MGKIKTTVSAKSPFWPQNVVPSESFVGRLTDSREARSGKKPTTLLARSRPKKEESRLLSSRVKGGGGVGAEESSRGNI